MPCPKCGNPSVNVLCPNCTTNTADSAEMKCQNCGQMTLDKNNRCHYCNGIFKCDLCKNDMEKFDLPPVNNIPLGNSKNPYGFFPNAHIIRQSSSFLEFKDFVNFSSTNPYIYNAVHSFPVTRNPSTIKTNSGCKIVAIDGVFEGVRIEYVCRTCLNKIREVSFAGCVLKGTLPTMPSLKKLSFIRCTLSGTLPNMIIDELHFDRCKFSIDIIAFISSVPVVVPIVWELEHENIGEIIGNVKQIANRKIKIKIHAPEPMISTEKWGSLLSEVIASNDISLMRWQYEPWQQFYRIIITFYVPGKKYNYYCTKCWKGYYKARTVCNAELEVGGIEEKCPSREFYICNNGKLEIFVPHRLTPMIQDQQPAIEANNETQGFVNPHRAPQQVSTQDQLENWQLLMDVEQDYINSQLIPEYGQLQPPDTLVKHFISPLCMAQPALHPAAQLVLTKHPMHGRELTPPFSGQQGQQSSQPATTTTSASLEMQPTTTTTSASLEIQPPNKKRKI